MKNLIQSLLIVLLSIISFCVFYYIVFIDSQKLSISSVFIEVGVSLILSIEAHEFGHYIVGKYYKYSLLSLIVLGIKITKTLNNEKKYKLEFSPEWLLSGTVVFDYQKEITSEDSLSIFYEKFRYISLGGPAISLFIIIMSLVFYSISIITYPMLLIILLINSMILVGGCFSNSTEINDIDLFFKVSKYKNNLFYWICFNNNISNNTFILDKKEILAEELISKKTISAFEMMFMCNTIWEMYDNGKLNVKINLKLCQSYKEIKCSNIYYYYLIISILVIINYTINKEKAIELYNYIQNKPRILFVLKEKSSGVSYFILLMENIICNKQELIEDSLILKARNKIGLDFN
ncbi:peptidase M50-like protein [Lachnotalea glycerini]|uniref:Peptidase M50-like protein n=1 Tax=Lachnotalea glycerini TaxID=1763509 RepID=A0A255ING8_9FIRM|nr:site-2 protease family protein [Lachnotalea glycerini]PXV88299.1 peptidase M50-like protein [Lachnotalea glycerini]RDY30879.1 hypothetical protein CG710_012465 [Lachnotalea glycerini]